MNRSEKVKDKTRYGQWKKNNISPYIKYPLNVTLIGKQAKRCDNDIKDKDIGPYFKNVYNHSSTQIFRHKLY